MNSYQFGELHAAALEKVSQLKVFSFKPLSYSIFPTTEWTNEK